MAKRMKQRLLGMAVLVLGVMAVAASLPEYPYKGSKRCKSCHTREDLGSQYTRWKESAHSKAFEALGKDEAKKAAEQKGIEAPQTSKECLKCHATASGVDPKLLRGLVQEEGVSCETCHGPAGHYWRSEIMKDPEKAKEMGLTLSNNKEFCLTCHNAGCPSDEKAFDFDTYMEKIKHWGFIQRGQTQ